MYEGFKNLIYKSEEDEKAVIEKVILYVMELNSCTREELLEAISKDEPETSKERDIQYDYCMELNLTENCMLFNLTVDRFGRKLWSNNAWHNKTCRRKCPFGSICKKRLFEIDSKLFCYGQLYVKHNEYISSDSIEELFSKQHIRVINADGTVYVDTKSPNFDIQMLAWCFDEYVFFLDDFGNKYTRYPNKIFGNNAIHLLKKDNLSVEG